MTTIILKADDFQASKRWLRLLKYSDEKQLPLAVGIIGQWLENEPAIALQYTQWAKHLEPYAHGYKHVMNEYTLLNTAAMRHSLVRTLAVIKLKLGIDCIGFGAPGNNMNRKAEVLLRDTFQRIKVVFLPEKCNEIIGKLNLHYYGQSNIERPCHKPNLRTLKYYYKSGNDYHVFQLHPESWDWSRFNEFRQCVTWLTKQGAEFKSMSEYYKEVNE